MTQNIQELISYPWSRARINFDKARLPSEARGLRNIITRIARLFLALFEAIAIGPNFLVAAFEGKFIFNDRKFEVQKTPILPPEKTPKTAAMIPEPIKIKENPSPLPEKPELEIITIPSEPVQSSKEVTSTPTQPIETILTVPQEPSSTKATNHTQHKTMALAAAAAVVVLSAFGIWYLRVGTETIPPESVNHYDIPFSSIFPTAAVSNLIKVATPTVQHYEAPPVISEVITTTEQSTQIPYNLLLGIPVAITAFGAAVLCLKRKFCSQSSDRSKAVSAVPDSVGISQVNPSQKQKSQTERVFDSALAEKLQSDRDLDNGHPEKQRYDMAALIFQRCARRDNYYPAIIEHLKACTNKKIWPYYFGAKKPAEIIKEAHIYAEQALQQLPLFHKEQGTLKEQQEIILDAKEKIKALEASLVKPAPKKAEPGPSSVLALNKAKNKVIGEGLGLDSFPAQHKIEDEMTDKLVDETDPQIKKLEHAQTLLKQEKFSELFNYLQTLIQENCLEAKVWLLQIYAYERSQYTEVLQSSDIFQILERAIKLGQDALQQIQSIDRSSISKEEAQELNEQQVEVETALKALQNEEEQELLAGDIRILQNKIKDVDQSHLPKKIEETTKKISQLSNNNESLLEALRTDINNGLDKDAILAKYPNADFPQEQMPPNLGSLISNLKLLEAHKQSLHANIAKKNTANRELNQKEIQLYEIEMGRKVCEANAQAALTKNSRPSELVKEMIAEGKKGSLKKYSTQVPDTLIKLIKEIVALEKMIEQGYLKKMDAEKQKIEEQTETKESQEHKA